MYIYKLALRNIKRNKRRSILAIISVMLSIMFVMVMNGMVSGYLSSIVKNYTKNETGHVRVATQKFVDNSNFFPVTHNIENIDNVIKEIKADPEIASHIVSIAPRITFGVLLSRDGKQKSALGYAGDVEIEKDLLMLQNSIVEGTYLQKERDIIIGSGVAEALGYKIGDDVKVMTTGSDYALNMRKFKVVGIFTSGLSMMDDRVFQIKLIDAQKLLRMGTDVQHLTVNFDDHNHADAYAAKINASISDTNIVATSWTQIGDYYNMVKLASATYNFIYFIVALLGAIIIGNIMMIVVMERKREIGIIKSMGLAKSTILVLFILEGLYLGLIGAIAGVILGTLFNLYFSINGLDLTAMMQGVNMPMDNVVYFHINPGMMLIAILLGVAIATIMSFLPAKRAADMNIIEAMRSV